MYPTHGIFLSDFKDLDLHGLCDKDLLDNFSNLHRWNTYMSWSSKKQTTVS